MTPVAFVIFYLKKLTKILVMIIFVLTDYLPAWLQKSWMVRFVLRGDLTCKLWQTCSCKTYLLLLIWKRYTHTCMYIYIYVRFFMRKNLLYHQTNDYMVFISNVKYFFEEGFTDLFVLFNFNTYELPTTKQRSVFIKIIIFTCNSMSEYTENFVCYFVNKLVM